jgi:electron transport complex protein RnfB
VETLADRIDAILPQTQCEQCGYHGCRPYAEAIARGDAQINQCPPGGAAGIARLAALLDRPPLPLNPANGVEKPRMLARVIEADCIGCTKCIQACPVDAIVGASRLMHTVLIDRCTGCELCLPPCPVDCIVMADAGRAAESAAERRQRADAARERFAAHNARLLRERERGQRQAAADQASAGRAAVLAAIARAKSRRQGKPDPD